MFKYIDTLKTVVSLCLCLFLSVVSSQPAIVTSVPLNHYSMKCFDVDDGLPQNSITDLAINTDGQLIIATYSGVVVFDGHRFSNLIPGTTTPFPNVEAFTLAVEPEGVIWVGTTSSGLYRLAGTELMHWDTDNGLSSHIIRKIKVIDEGVLVNNDGNVLYFENNAENELIHLQPAENFSLLSQFEDIGTRIIAADYKRSFTSRPTAYSLKKTATSQLLQGNYYVAKSGQLHRIVDGVQSLIVNDFSTQTPISIYNLMYDTQHNLWISTIKNGLFRYGSNGLESFGLLNTNRFSSVVEDVDGAIWLGTSSGLCSLSIGAVKNFGAEQGLFKENIKSLATNNKNQVYAIPYGKNTQLIAIENNQVTNLPLTGNLPSEGLNIHRLFTDKNELVWIATDTFIGQLDGSQVTRVIDLDTSSKVLIEHNESLWYQQHNSLVKWRNGEKKLFPFKQDTPLDIRSLSVAVNGDVLIGEKHNFYRIHGSSISKIDIPIGVGSCLHEFIAGEIWGCSDGLWLRIDGKNHHFDYHNNLTSVVNGHIHDVRQDHQGNLWVIANSGLFRLLRIDLDDYLSGKNPVPKFVKFSEQDNIKSSEFNSSSSSSVMTQNGHLWFASQGGVVNVIPAEVFPSSDKELKPFIEMLITGETHIDPINTTELAANPKAIQIHFGAVYLSDNKNIRFRHQLLPIYNDWHSGRVANIAELPPGSYQLILQAQYNNNAWSAPFEKKFIVLPAWYQTWWFRLIFVLMVLFMFFVIPQWRLKRLNNNRKELKQLVKKQTESLIQANKKLDVLSRLDELTQIPNRREFINKINAMCKKPGSQFCLALIDIDDFKAYNDYYGHMSGDQCLKEVANLINDSSEDAILVARFGGEEFVILFSELNINQANDVLKNIHSKIADKQLIHQKSIAKSFITLSSGLVSRKYNESVDSIIERADIAMYQAKTEGKDRIVIAG